MDPEKIEEKITSRTKAILVVDIFGQSADMDPILEIAKKYKLKVISDCAQSPGARYKGKLAGTMGDVGGYSFNYHKHIHTGEGGMIVTNDDLIANKCQLIRNHAEAAIVNIENADLTNMIGYNFRLGEIESAIGIQQLDKLENAIFTRQKAAQLLTKNLQDIGGLTTPYIREGCTHVYYFYAMKHNENVTGVSRDTIHQALIEEGVPLISKEDLNLFSKAFTYFPPKKFSPGAPTKSLKIPLFTTSLDAFNSSDPMELYGENLKSISFLPPFMAKTGLFVIDNILNNFNIFYRRIDTT